ncbi:complex I assembly factor TMEM126B, mitochondrial [Trichosurus vulpecula]|uniref:complex I assembly factor TMEM126B, mitochondrial n=1 Tax=Trichosurus vulpecula TaxID=9337 RepID=UPI00186B23CC|nr:complex I assembly factor TMEM126B, mitochondrial [Trichosurus vulpecula]
MRVRLGLRWLGGLGRGVGGWCTTTSRGSPTRARSKHSAEWRRPGESTGTLSERATVVSARGDTREGYRMVTHTYIQSDPFPEEIKLRRLRTIDLVEQNLWRLSKKDQMTYTYGPLFIGSASSFCGFLANYLFRHCMKVKQHSFQTFVPLSAIPFLTTAVAYKFLVTDPLSSGDLTMDMCILRGAFVSASCGIFHPSALAFLKNGRLAVKYETVPLPPRGRNLYHWTVLCQSAAKLMIIPMIIQTVCGGHLAFLQHKICCRIFELLEHV